MALSDLEVNRAFKNLGQGLPRLRTLDLSENKLSKGVHEFITAVARGSLEEIMFDEEQTSLYKIVREALLKPFGKVVSHLGNLNLCQNQL